MPRRSRWPRVAALVAAGVLMIAVVGSLGFLIANDLGLRTTVHNLNAKLGSVRASASAVASNDQLTISAQQGMISSLQAQIPVRPDFVVAGQGWQGPCGEDSCYPDGSFVNQGKAGEAVAVFEITATAGSSPGSVLAACTVSLGMTAALGTTDASCTASSASLSQYFDDNPGGKVGLTVTVQNP
jgi:uncharacterized low-complexity protein